jgi:AcrR family transcriptional regulator
MSHAPTEIRRRLPREARRTQLLAVAEEVFAELGYQGASLENVAARARVTRPLIYNYFKSKDDLYLECVRRAREELEQSMLDAVATQTAPALQFRAATTAFFRFVQDRGRRWDMLFGGGSAVAGSVAAKADALQHATIERLAALLLSASRELGEDEAVAYASAVNGAGVQLAKWWRTRPEVPLEQMVERHMAVVWHGLERLVPPPGPPDLTVVPLMFPRPVSGGPQAS